MTLYRQDTISLEWRCVDRSWRAWGEGVEPRIRTRETSNVDVTAAGVGLFISRKFSDIPRAAKECGGGAK